MAIDLTATNYDEMYFDDILQMYKGLKIQTDTERKNVSAASGVDL